MDNFFKLESDYKYDFKSEYFVPKAKTTQDPDYKGNKI